MSDEKYYKMKMDGNISNVKKRFADLKNPKVEHTCFHRSLLIIVWWRFISCKDQYDSIWKNLSEDGKFI